MVGDGEPSAWRSGSGCKGCPVSSFFDQASNAGVSQPENLFLEDVPGYGSCEETSREAEGSVMLIGAS
jgi:hypothetical protein